MVAVGGGTVTDAVGFAAATFRRGIAWIAAPTTLVGQVDAAIGGKTAINVAAKNDVGAFHVPERVVCDCTVLETLPPREWAAGFAEAVKTALLVGGPLLELVESWEPGAGELDARVELVRRCAAVKAAVVAEDPTERGRRAILNLGHTIGHGVEAAAGYGGLLHGEAVAVGLSAALWLSVQLHDLDPAVLAADGGAARAPRPPVRAPGVDADAVHAAMRGDKKRAGRRDPDGAARRGRRARVGASTPATARSTQRSSGRSPRPERQLRMTRPNEADADVEVRRNTEHLELGAGHAAISNCRRR